MASTGLGPPLDAGRRAIASMRKAAAERIVDLIRRCEPGLLDGITEVGLVSRDWVDEPGRGPITTSTPLEVLERTLAGILERRPSLLASLGLSAIEVLSVSSSTTDEAALTHPELTVAFTDLEGFTRFTAHEGDDRAAHLLAEHYAAAGPLVRSRGGRVVKRLGDGLLMTFTEPSAAVLAALELVESPPEPLRVRAGLHVGDVVKERHDVVGHVVNVAARLTETARGGEVLISEELRDALAEEGVEQVAIGRARRRRLKGVGEWTKVYPVTRP